MCPEAGLRQGNRIWIFTDGLQTGKLIRLASASFSMCKTDFLKAMCEQIDAVGNRIQPGSGFFCNSDVKRIPNAIPLGVAGQDQG